MFKIYFILIILLLVSGAPVNGQQDTLKLVPGISVGFMGTNITAFHKGTRDRIYNTHLTWGGTESNFNLKLTYGKNTLDMGLSVSKREVFGYFGTHVTVDRGLTGLLLNYQREIFSSKVISFHGSYVFLNRYLNNYTADAHDGLGEFMVNYFSIEQFLGYALKVRLYRQLYLEQKSGFGYGFGKRDWNYKNGFDQGKINFEGKSILFSIAIGYDFQRKNQTDV